jgi:hypothetical protein
LKSPSSLLRVCLPHQASEEAALTEMRCDCLYQRHPGPGRGCPRLLRVHHQEEKSAMDQCAKLILHINGMKASRFEIRGGQVIHQ